MGCETTICFCRCYKYVCFPYVYMLYTHFWKWVEAFQCSRRKTLENLQIWDAVINVSGQQFHFPLLRLGKTEESATGDPHQRSRQTHLPGCQISRQQIGRKLKNLGQIWSLLWACKEVWKVPTQIFMLGIKPPWKLLCFSLCFCHTFNRNMSSEYEGMRSSC